MFCRVAHKLWDFWRRNCGICTAARTHTWLKNYGILHLPRPDPPTPGWPATWLLLDRAEPSMARRVHPL